MFCFPGTFNTIYLINCFGLGTKMSTDFEPKRLVLHWFPPLPIAYAQLKNEQNSVTLIIPAIKIRNVFITFAMLEVTLVASSKKPLDHKLTAASFVWKTSCLSNGQTQTM